MLIATWLNGAPCASLSMTERGFAYGDGHFTTLPVRDGVPVLAEPHWRRLEEASRRLGIAAVGMTEARHCFATFCAAYPNVTARIIVTRGEGGRGYLPGENAVPNLYFQAWRASPHPLSCQDGIATDVLQGRLGLVPVLAGLKHLNRLEQVMLRRELAETPYPEGIVCDLRGHVIEGVFSNLFLVRGGEVLTPVLDHSGVAGVMRAYLLEYIRQTGRRSRERIVTEADIRTADELFFCNSLAGIWPVARFGGRMMPANPVTRSLQQHLTDARITP